MAVDERQGLRAPSGTGLRREWVVGRCEVREEVRNESYFGRRRLLGFGVRVVS